MVLVYQESIVDLILLLVSRMAGFNRGFRRRGKELTLKSSCRANPAINCISLSIWPADMEMRMLFYVKCLYL